MDPNSSEGKKGAQLTVGKGETSSRSKSHSSADEWKSPQVAKILGSTVNSLCGLQYKGEKFVVPSNALIN
jgi:hypothetical protein